MKKWLTQKTLNSIYSQIKVDRDDLSLAVISRSAPNVDYYVSRAVEELSFMLEVKAFAPGRVILAIRLLILALAKHCVS